MLCSFLKVIHFSALVTMPKHRVAAFEQLCDCLESFLNRAVVKVRTVESNRQGRCSFLLSPPPNIDPYSCPCNSMETVVTTRMGFGHQISPQENLSSVSDWKSDPKVVTVDIFHIYHYCLWKWKHRGYVFGCQAEGHKLF